MSVPARLAVLLSVRPPHVERLLDGTKTVELRRRMWRAPPGTLVLLYASGERRQVVGTLVVVQTETGPAEAVWERFGEDAAVTRSQFDDYFQGAASAVAIRVADPQPLAEPVGLCELRRRLPRFTVPQSFRYVGPDELFRVTHCGYGDSSAEDSAGRSFAQGTLLPLS